MIWNSNWILILGTILTCWACADAAYEETLIPETSVEHPPEESPSPHQVTPSPQPNEPELSGPNCADTAAVSHAQAPTLMPSSRIVSMRVPTTPREARELGCIDVQGSNGGLGLSALLNALDVDLNAIVQPDERGDIPSIILGHMSGWEPGQTGNVTEGLNLHMYAGEWVEGRTFHVDSESDSEDSVIFPATVLCQELETEPENLVFDLPVDDGVVPFALESVEVSGRLAIEEEGFAIREGMIIGYIADTSIKRIVAAMQETCRENPLDPMCESASFLLNGDADFVTTNIVLPFLHGLDAHLDLRSGTAEDCMDSECNAMSICIRFSSEPVSVLKDD